MKMLFRFLPEPATYAMKRLSRVLLAAGAGMMLCSSSLFASSPHILTQPTAERWSRPWKIYVVAHTHADIGYTDLIPEVQRSWADGLDQAVAATQQGYKWTLEGSLLFDAYRQLRGPEKVAQLVELIRQRQVELAALYTSILTETAGPEELVRPPFMQPIKCAAPMASCPEQPCSATSQA